MSWFIFTVSSNILSINVVGNTLINSINTTFENIDYINEHDGYITILGSNESLTTEMGTYDNPVSIYICINGFGNFEEVLYEDGDGWSSHTELNELLNHDKISG